MDFSQDLIEKIIILIITAVLTGLIVPYISKKMDEMKAKSQKSFEADIARQDKIIEAQSRLIDDISRILWQWRYLSIKVAYYGSSDNNEKYDMIKKEYDESIWNILNQFRNEITKARMLASDDSYQKLLNFYEYIVELDKKISSLFQDNELNENQKMEFAKINSLIYTDATKGIDDIIGFLARDFHLIRD